MIVSDQNQNTATMATTIKDSFTHRIQSAHVDSMEYLINVHLPLTQAIAALSDRVMVVYSRLGPDVPCPV
jgi:hypothetical protein